MERLLVNNGSSTHYHIFILTIWYEAEADSADPATWRIRLEDSKTKVSVGCVGSNELLDLLSQQIMVKSTKAEATVNEPKT